METIQDTVNNLATAVIQSSKRIYCWGQKSIADERDKESLFHQIAASREVCKVVLQLTGAFAGLQRACQMFLEMFDKYQYLWRVRLPCHLKF